MRRYFAMSVGGGTTCLGVIEGELLKGSTKNATLDLVRQTNVTKLDYRAAGVGKASVWFAFL